MSTIDFFLEKVQNLFPTIIQTTIYTIPDSSSLKRLRRCAPLRSLRSLRCAPLEFPSPRIQNSTTRPPLHCRWGSCSLGLGDLFQGSGEGIPIPWRWSMDCLGSPRLTSGAEGRPEPAFWTWVRLEQSCANVMAGLAELV